MAIDRITTGAVLDGAIATADIADNAVTTAKITDANITTAKVADDAITGAKIENNPTIAGNTTINGFLGAKGGAVFNEDSADVDFRVESNGNANMLFVNAGSDAVNIGTTDSTFGFNVGGSGSDIRGKFQGSNQYRLSLRNGTSDQVYLGSGGANNFRISNNSGSTLFELTSASNILLPTANAGIYLGATSETSANLLDDYEEGTATVTMNGGSAHPASRLQTTAYYTKIGSTVNINFEFNNVNTTGYGGYISVFGLPFAASSPGGTVTRQVCGQIAVYGGATFSSDGGIFGRLNEGGTEIILWNNGSNTAWEQVTHNAGTGRYLIMNITYRTDS